MNHRIKSPSALTLVSLAVLAASTLAACGSSKSPSRDGGPDAADAADAATTSDATDTAIATDANDATPTPDANDAAPTDVSVATDATDASADATDASPEVAPISNCGTAGSLLMNCSFETPAAPAGGSQNFATAATIGAWTVTGTGGLSTLSGTFQQLGFSFPAHDGAQTVDLTGNAVNAIAGVSQSVATTVGKRYELTFWVGNIVHVGGVFGTTSTVQALVNGVPLTTAVNSDGAGTTVLSWKAFTASFTATTASTTIELRNADPSTDNSNILDDVTLVQAP